ncbi:MAG: hypothetical protein P8009_06250 [Gammaproteobacteria bacterium]
MKNSMLTEKCSGCRAAVWVLAGTLMSLPALAASPRLDNANAHLVKAAALLKAAGYTGEQRAVTRHREEAIRLIERAEREIARAKQAADAPQGQTGVQPAPRLNPGLAPRMR